MSYKCNDPSHRECNLTEIREAEKLTRKFSHRKIAGYIDIAVNWPVSPRIFAKADALGYRSNKFDGKWRDYIHFHDKPLPNIWIESGDNTHKNKKIWGQPVSLAVLGFALDLQYTKNKKKYHLDWKQNKDLPLLCGCPSSQRLFIIPQDGGFPVMLESPVMEIRSEGIVH